MARTRMPRCSPARTRAYLRKSFLIRAWATCSPCAPPGNSSIARIASLEYAVKKLHVSLICVLGHEHCGAIEAAEQELDDLMHTITSEADGSLEAADAMDDLDEHIAAAESIILRQTGMSVWQAREAELDAHEDIERVHVAHIIETLVEQSPVIQQALAADKLMIVGARYQLDSGKVEVLSF